MANLKKFFLKQQQKIADLAGQNCNIVRPAYGSAANTETTVASNVKIKVEVAQAKLSQSPYTSVTYYTIFGKRSLFQAGDIIIPDEPGSTTPPVTVVSYSPLEECMGVATSRIGKICYTDGSLSSSDMYTNVRFDWVGPGFPLSPGIDYIKDLLAVPSKKAVLFTRTNLQSQNNLSNMSGLRLVETDGISEVRWIIKVVDVVNNITILTLSQEY